MSTRNKECRFCHRSFTLNIWVETTIEEDLEGRLANIKNSIEYGRRTLKQSIEKRYETLRIVRALNKDRDKIIEYLDNIKPVGSA